jgi:uncharacterized protein YqcC (DUF446 family)
MIETGKSKTLAKIDEIIAELEKNNLWKNTEPAWVKNYEANINSPHNDFEEWLQFVYLPNCMAHKAGAYPSIVPQAMKHFGEDVKKGTLLQLLIELDAMI